MARLCLCLLLLARAALGTTDAVDLFEGDGISGIARVVKLLEGMSAKLEEEQKADEELKEKFECWCKKNDKDKKAAIAAGKEKVAKLTAAIGELGPRIEELSKQIRTATQEKNANLAALDTANALRAKQSESFKKDEEDLGPDQQGGGCQGKNGGTTKCHWSHWAYTRCHYNEAA